MKEIISIGGSSIKNSINKQLAEYAADNMKNVTVTKLDLNDYNLPIYSIDVENQDGFPSSLLELSQIIEKTDGIVISLAEHNGAYSAAFKNTFDWLSRIDGKVWRNKPMLLLSTSPGARGGQSVMDLALSRFPYNGGNIIASMTFPSFQKNFVKGEIINAELKNRLEQHSNELLKKL